MSAIPLTGEEERYILSVLGMRSTEDLFSTIPPKLRENADFRFDLPWLPSAVERGLTEPELRLYFSALSGRNTMPPPSRCFAGMGQYSPPLPALLEPLAGRSEFLSPPSSRFPNVAQGTLQALFEFQTLICRMTGMDAAQAVPDSTVALAQLVREAERRSQGQEIPIYLSEALHPEASSALRSLLAARPVRWIPIRWGEAGGVDLSVLGAAVGQAPPAAMLVGYPNALGVIEPLGGIRERLPKQARLIIYLTDLSALSIFEPPGALGADLVVGEARQFAFPFSGGGASAGFVAARAALRSELPGTFVAQTRTGRAHHYTLTPRRRSRRPLTHALAALRATITLSALGKAGFLELGQRNYSHFDFLVQELGALGVPLHFPRGTHYREGAFEVPDLDARWDRALKAGIVPGIRLASRFSTAHPGFLSSLLISVHPGHSKSDLEALVEVLT